MIYYILISILERYIVIKYLYLCRKKNNSTLWKIILMKKRSTKYINNNKTNRNIFYSTNIKIKNKNNSMRDNLFKKTNNETNYMNRGNYNKKNIKLNDNILINRTNDHINNINNYLPKFSSINNSNTNIRDNYNSNIEFSREFIDNKTINNKSIRNTNMNKNYYFRVLTNKKRN